MSALPDALDAGAAHARMADTAPLSYLTAWFARQCDGDWEHDLGIRIETLDNPGWAVDIA